jgi:hypothetical protein
MSNRIVEVLCGFLLVLMFLVSGCGNGTDKSETVGGDSRTDASSIRVALCPKDGGQLKFLHLDSMKVKTSDIVVPLGTNYLGDIPSSPQFAAVTEEVLYLIQEDEEPELKKISIPAVSQNLSILPTHKGVLIMDYETSRLLRIDIRSGVVDFDRTLHMRPEEIYYFPSQARIVVVMQKGATGVISTFASGGVESMTINLETILCSTSAVEDGIVYAVTEGMEGPRMEAFSVTDLSRTQEITLEQEPGSIVRSGADKRLYLYYPNEGVIKAIEGDEGDVIAEIPLKIKGAGKLYSDEAGRYVYLLMEGTGHLVAISTATNKVAGEIESQDGDTRLLTTPNSRFVILQDSNNARVRLYDGDGFQLLRVFMEETPVAITLLKETDGELPAENIQVAKQRSEVAASPPSYESASLQSGDWENPFTLQFFSSDSLESSERIADLLVLAGYPAYIEEAMMVGKGTWYRVKMGEFSNDKDAEVLGEYLKGIMGLDFWVTRVDDPEMLHSAGIDITLAGQDMDADGIPEIAVVSPAGIVHLFSLHGTRFVPRWSYSLPENQALCGIITYGDENGDGLPEALLPLCPLDRPYIVAWTGYDFKGNSG